MKNRGELTLVTVVAVAAFVRGEDWVWSSNGRSLDGGSRRIYRPADVGQRPSKITDYGRPPAPIYESNGGDFSATPPRPAPPPSYQQPYRPGGGGILTGPTPSWERHDGGGGRYHDYAHCKCAHSFNCASPGILFGSCDIDKQYCCSDKKTGRYEPGGLPFDGRDEGRPPRFDGREEGRPPRFDGREEGRPPRFDGREEGRPPRFDGREEGRPPPYGRPVLVGPGGPTGVPGNYGYGNYRPQHGDGFYEPYARSSSIDGKATKN